jgi:hypothetical protein
MFRRLGQLYTGVERTYKTIIMALVLIALAGAGYTGYLAYGKVAGMFGLIKNSYGRGVGIAMICAPNEQQDGALCYPKCREGYQGVGPVCWQACPAGFRDDGAFCAKPEPYGRGAGYAWHVEDGFSDAGMFNRCDAEQGKGNCEKSGAIVYPRCRAGFHATGCCICSPNCPSDMPDMGVSCTKGSYGRTAGTPLHACPEGYEKDGALCYPLCKPKYKGVGPVCWEES